MKGRNVFVRSPYNYDVEAASKESGFYSDEESLTQQGPSEDADINTIVRRFGLTGQLPVGARMPTSGDFSSAGDFHTCMQVLREAEEEFMLLPGEVRARFENDPGRFVAFVENPENIDEIERLGFLSDEAKARRLAARSATPNVDPGAPGGSSEPPRGPK